VRNKYSGKLSVIDNNPHLREWRLKVTGYAKQEMGDWDTLMEAVKVEVTFLLPRPKSHYRTAQGHEHELLDWAPLYPTTPPDIDKLERAILDGLTDAGVWLDDSQVVTLHADKRYQRWDEVPGAVVTVYPY
jgi:Holliday junction resolvase RusA-like endonuclease